MTDSQGEVVEFDQSGLRRGGVLLSGVRKKDDWSQCLVVSPGDMDPAVADMMGEGLFAFSLQLSLLSLFLRQSGTQTTDITGGRKCLP